MIEIIIYILKWPTSRGGPFSYTHFMHSYEWNQSEQEQFESMCFQMQRVMRSSFYRYGQKRIMTTMLLIGLCPVLVMMLSSWDEQDAFSIGGGVLIFGILAYFLVLKNPSDQSIDRLARKEAKRYMNSLEKIPTGPHRVRLVDDRVEWVWVEVGIQTSFPFASIRAISEHGGSVHLRLPNNLVYSIPFHAFRDQANRDAFIRELKSGSGNGDSQ